MQLSVDAVYDDVLEFANDLGEDEFLRVLAAEAGYGPAKDQVIVNAILKKCVPKGAPAELVGAQGPPIQCETRAEVRDKVAALVVLLLPKVREAKRSNVLSGPEATEVL